MIETNQIPTSRKVAAEAGERYYFTGKACKSGHVSKRATQSGTCVECTRSAASKWAELNKDRFVGYSAKYRTQNHERIRVADNAAHKAAREAQPEKHQTLARARYAASVERAGREVRPFNKLPLSTLVQRLQEVHQGALLYVGGYIGMTTNATFLCVAHQQEVTAHPHNVFRGANPCPRCNHMASRGETEVAQFLFNLAPGNQRDREVIHPKELDIYLPEKNLAVEYCGMYWHSAFNAGDNRTMQHKHREKHQACADKGIRLLTIYESEWKEHEYAIRRLLRNAVGKSRGSVMARKCDLRKVSNPEATLFYNRYHPQGGAGSGEHYGLYWSNKLVACMRFVLGANDRGVGARNRTWTLSRYATRVTVAGGASRLFTAFLREFNPETVKSFSDNRYFKGDMYTSLGFTTEGDSVPDYQVWSPKIGLSPKTHYQRRNIPKRLVEHGKEEEFNPEGDPRSEAEMTYSMGCGRIYDCGKKKWVYRNGCTPIPNVI